MVSPIVPRFTLSIKTIILAIVVGVLAGLGSIAFLIMLQLSTKVLLGLAGYTPPSPAGEEMEFIPVNVPCIGRPIIIILPAAGGLISGAISYKLAPETEGDGTDATIEAFHRKRGLIKGRVPLVKAVTSAILIGSGGSAGREGPISQIGGGVASFIATKLGLSEREREILVVAGLAAGIGSIFRSPLGGSIFGIETLYKKDYEVEALVPAVLSTFVAYIVFSVIVGWRPIFDTPPYSFTSAQLPFFAALGVLAGLMARLYVYMYTKVRECFQGLKNPIIKPIKPAIGGLMVGVIGYFIPQALETGYGWIQLAIWGKIALEILIIVVFVKMIATSLSVGSGGSGGLFAPSLVIGGFLGGVVGYVFHEMFPQYIDEPGVFILVGMGCFFAAAAKVPLASIIMVAEMTGDYNILAPAFLASVIAYLVSGDASIYEKQIDVRIHSPLHEREFIATFLGRLKVEEIAIPDIRVVREDMRLDMLERVFRESDRLALPVINKEGKYVGIVAVDDLFSIPIELRANKYVRDIVKCKFVCVDPKDSLLTALYKMVEHELPELPVVDMRTKELRGEVSFRDVIKLLHYSAEEYFGELKIKYKVRA